MAEQSYSKLKKKYKDFSKPQGNVLIKGTPVDGKEALITSIDAELSGEFDASAAVLNVTGVFDRKTQLFRQQVIDRYFQIGSEIELQLGYSTKISSVFHGYICGISYVFDTPEKEPHLTVECMDAKGLMMVNCSHTQKKEKSYGECVGKILQEYSFLIKEKQIGTTPQESKEIEMTDESDYEFLVRTARKLGFDFFISGKKLIFDHVREKKSTVFTLDQETLFQWYTISYNIAGMAKKITVRGTNDGSGKALKATVTNGNRYGSGGSYNRVIGNSERIYIDETVSTDNEAKNRAEAIQKRLAWNFGQLRASVQGIPEILPGCFLSCTCIAQDVKKTFYITRVRHRLDQSGYTTDIEGRLAGL